jgi:hypothetical protein
MAHEKPRSDSKVYNTSKELLVIATSASTENAGTYCKTSKLMEIGNAPCHWYL